MSVLKNKYYLILILFTATLLFVLKLDNIDYMNQHFGSNKDFFNEQVFKYEKVCDCDLIGFNHRSKYFNFYTYKIINDIQIDNSFPIFEKLMMSFEQEKNYFSRWKDTKTNTTSDNIEDVFSFINYGNLMNYSCSRAFVKSWDHTKLNSFYCKYGSSGGDITLFIYNPSDKLLHILYKKS